VESTKAARAFFAMWVAQFGTPSDLSSDRGSQFICELWNTVGDILHVTLHRTTAYHPQANGLCECFHRYMKAMLRASFKDSSWVDRLPWVMLGLRTAPKVEPWSSSVELVYGQPLWLPGEFVPNITAHWSAAHQWTKLLDIGRVFAPVPIMVFHPPTSL